MAQYRGGCHCGNLWVEFISRFMPEELPLRACQCTFCRGHGVVSTSDPRGTVRIRVRVPEILECYRFGFGITDFLLCRRCGVYVAAVTIVNGAKYAVLNANALDARAQLTGIPQPMDYGRETPGARRARRASGWTPVGSGVPGMCGISVP